MRFVRLDRIKKGDKVMCLHCGQLIKLTDDEICDDNTIKCPICNEKISTQIYLRYGVRAKIGIKGKNSPISNLTYLEKKYGEPAPLEFLEDYDKNPCKYCVMNDSCDHDRSEQVIYGDKYPLFTRKKHRCELYQIIWWHAVKDTTNEEIYQKYNGK